MKSFLKCLVIATLLLGSLAACGQRVNLATPESQTQDSKAY